MTGEVMTTTNRELSPQVKLIADMLFKHHMDKLDNPSLTDLTPYIQPILDSFHQALFILIFFILGLFIGALTL